MTRLVLRAGDHITVQSSPTGGHEGMFGVSDEEWQPGGQPNSTREWTWPRRLAPGSTSSPLGNASASLLAAGAAEEAQVTHRGVGGPYGGEASSSRPRSAGRPLLPTSATLAPVGGTLILTSKGLAPAVGLARTDTATQLADAPIPTNSSTNSRDSSQGLLKLNSKLGSSKKVRFSTADAEQPEDAPTEGAADDQLDARMETLLSSLRPPGADKAAGQSASDTLNQAPGTPRSVLHKAKSAGQMDNGALESSMQHLFRLVTTKSESTHMPPPRRAVSGAIAMPATPTHSGGAVPRAPVPPDSPPVSAGNFTRALLASARLRATSCPQTPSLSIGSTLGKSSGGHATEIDPDLERSTGSDKSEDMLLPQRSGGFTSASRTQITPFDDADEDLHGGYMDATPTRKSGGSVRSSDNTRVLIDRSIRIAEQLACRSGPYSVRRGGFDRHSAHAMQTGLSVMALRRGHRKSEGGVLHQASYDDDRASPLTQSGPLLRCDRSSLVRGVTAHRRSEGYVLGSVIQCDEEDSEVHHSSPAFTTRLTGTKSGHTRMSETGLMRSMRASQAGSGNGVSGEGNVLSHLCALLAPQMPGRAAVRRRSTLGLISSEPCE